MGMTLDVHCGRPAECSNSVTWKIDCSPCGKGTVRLTTTSRRTTLTSQTRLPVGDVPSEAHVPLMRMWVS